MRHLYAYVANESTLRPPEVSLRKLVFQSACQYEVTSRVRDFQNGERSVHRRDG